MERNVRCPKCNSDFEVGEDVGRKDLIWCDTCSEELRVISINPLLVEQTESNLDEEDNMFDKI